MVCRPEFDNDLVSQNRRQPRFEFLDGQRVSEITYDGAFHVRTQSGTFSSRQLVGADGAYSVVNKTFGVATPKAVATAVEVNVSFSRLGGKPYAAPCFDYGAIDRGYGWIFPKDDHVSIGLYTLAKHTKNIREQLVGYMASKNSVPTGDPLEGFEAHRFPVGGFNLQVPTMPVYVVGDAGGFGDALTGEGIYHALESGRLAGLTCCDVAAGRRSHRSYYRRLWRTVLPDTAITYGLATQFYRNTDKSVGILAHPLVWRPIVQGYSQGSTFTQCLLLGGLYLVRSLARGSRNDRRDWNEARSI
jgi:flavin-dependent dehydrogenase